MLRADGDVGPQPNLGFTAKFQSAAHSSRHLRPIFLPEKKSRSYRIFV